MESKTSNRQIDFHTKNGNIKKSHNLIENENIVDLDAQNDSNNFYNEDFYDYEDIFMNQNKKAIINNNKKLNKKNPNSYVCSNEDFDDVDENENDSNNNLNNKNKNIKVLNRNQQEQDIEEDEYDVDVNFDNYDQEDDYDDDENNDFNTGPLAKKNLVNKNNQNNKERKNTVISDNIVSESQFFTNEPIEDADDNQEIFNYNPEDEDEGILDGPDNLLNTFFKRVDSLELVKPKKAKIVNDYLIGEMLGDGSYGKVKECLDMNSLARRAVKIINLKMVARKIPKGIENVRKEICIMKKLNHKNLIKLYDTFEKGKLNVSNNASKTEQVTKKETPNDIIGGGIINNLEKPPKLYIFMDYCMTSLEKLLKNAPTQRLCNWQANFYFKQLVDGLDYLHSLNIIHNDIKPGNLLITCDDVLKICDFSISAEIDPFCELNYLNGNSGQVSSSNDKELSADNSNYEANYGINPNLINNTGSSSNKFPIIQCTPMFQCPEMLDEEMNELLVLRYATKIDIWSSGITLYQLTTGSLPFQGNTIHQIFENIRSNSNQIKIPDFIDKNLNILLSGMLNKDPIERWSLKKIRDCEWFKRKHPVIRDDLAKLPDDVIQNEYSTFRMINYLEKYCETSKTSNEMSSYNNNTNNDPISDATTKIITPTQINENLQINQKSSNSTNIQNNNNNNIINNQKAVKKRESKLRRTQCNIM